ncbi:MAG: IS110 family transposase [Bacteroidales bacterium]|nr:IS110 family transposase [Bacteroidales bacterium]
MKKITQFEIICPNVAGIDVSDNGGMMVAYPINETEVVIEEFDCYTVDLRRISATLKSHNIRSVAMESTGVYWIPLFLLLQEDGFEVYLVNSKHVKNVTGRKDDEGDAEWIQKLHRCGLLSASFQPDNQTRSLRSVVRHRSSLVKTRSTYLNRMQKALEQMNLKIHTVISDIDGKTGLAIINAILSGERDPEKLADLCDPRIKASREEIIKSLEGFWLDEHLFELSQCYKLYEFHREIIEECDKKIETILQEIIKSKNNGVMPQLGKLKRKCNYKNEISIDVTNYLYELNKVDMVSVDGITGISAITALSIYSEIGDNLDRFKDEKHFTSWLGLAPNTKISGGKIISCRVPKKKHYAGQNFRMAALSLRNNKGTLGEYYRRIRFIAGPQKAVVALARKLAVIYFRMMTTKEKYNPQLLIDYQEKWKERKIKKLEKYLNKLKEAA